MTLVLVTGLIRAVCWVIVAAYAASRRVWLVVAAGLLAAAGNALQAFGEFALGGLVATPAVLLLCLALVDYVRDHPAP